MSSFSQYTMISSSSTFLIFFCIKAILNQYLWCLPKFLFLQQLFLLFLGTIVPFWCSKVHRLTLILLTKYLILLGLWGHHTDSIILRKIMDRHASLHHQEYCKYQKNLLKLSGDYELSKCSVFKVKTFWRHCSILKIQIIVCSWH